jgi:serine phosphatase RsbU (regulator of sigma subunit)
MGTLELDTGELRYVAAGHPPPLLLRRGHVVKTLDSGRRALLGLDRVAADVAEEWLEPDDVLVLYTDGITEARDADRRFFGLDRLVDFVEREAADGVPLPEIVRRVGRRILEHQNGVLQDDATMLLIQWTSSGQKALEPTPE